MSVTLSPEIFGYIVGGSLVAAAVPVLHWRFQRNRLSRLLQAIETRVRRHQSFYENLRRDSLPFYHCLDKRIMQALYDAQTTLSLVHNALAEIHTTLDDRDYAEFPAACERIEALLASSGFRSVGRSEAELGVLNNWDSRLELRLSFARSQIERLKARRDRAMSDSQTSITTVQRLS